jgi:hypothetical protein
MRYIDLQKPGGGGLQEMIRSPHSLRAGSRSFTGSSRHYRSCDIGVEGAKVPHIQRIAKKLDERQDFDGKEEESRKE